MVDAMPFFSKKNVDEVDYKARLERKLYLARENPELLFDLADCNLKIIPPGTFVLCKVFRKDALTLQNNQLADLVGGGKLQDLAQLQVLDLRSNRLKSLTKDIKHLSNLRELHLGYNKLTCLPEEIGQLKLLQNLDVSNNCLKQVPEVLGQLTALCVLDLRSNPLASLPTSLQQAHDSLQIFADSGLLSDFVRAPITAPPVMAKKEDKKMLDISKNNCPKEVENESQKLVLLLEARHKKQQELVQRLATYEDEQRSALATVLEHQKNQQSLALSIARTEEDHLTALSCVMQQEEARCSELAHNILKDEQSQQASLRQLLQREETRTIELTRALAKEEEGQRARLASVLASVPERCAPLVQLVLRDQQLQLSVLAAVRARQEAQSGQLSRCVVNEEQLRQAALAVVREKSDEQARQIAGEVATVQIQLGHLTALELQKRSDLNNEALNDLGDRRVTLSAVLTSLLKAQAERRQQLLEEVSHQLEGVGEALWLLQLQSLLDAVPSSLESSMPGLRDLAAALPTNQSPQHHSSPPVSKPESPSAPELSPLKEFSNICVPSAPHFASDDLECAICMDAQCTVVFLPCGHVCSCDGCSLVLAECPLCRQEITHKIPLVQGWSPI